MNYLPNFEASYSYVINGEIRYGVFYKEDGDGYRVIPLCEKSEEVAINEELEGKQLKYSPFVQYIPQLIADISIEALYIVSAKVLNSRKRIYAIHLDFFISASRIFVYRPGVINFFGIQWEKITATSYQHIRIDASLLPENSLKFPAHAYTGIADRLPGSISEVCHVINQYSSFLVW
jgi:hypothetical protein